MAVNAPPAEVRKCAYCRSVGAPYGHRPPGPMREIKPANRNRYIWTCAGCRQKAETYIKEKFG